MEKESARAVLGHVELDQIYFVDCELHTFDRFQTPPFNTDTTLNVTGSRREGVVEVRAKYTTDASKEQDGADPLALWTIGVECIAPFDVQSEDVEFSDSEVEAFALLVGAPAIHPYAAR